MASEPPAPKIYYPPLQKDNDIIPGRPGCLTLYIVLSLLTTIYLALTLYIGRDLLLELYNDPTISRTNFYFAMAMIVLIRGVDLISLIGLWFMKNWGRRIALVLLIASIILSVIVLIGSLIGIGPFLSRLAPNAIFNLIVNTIVIRWFLTNKVRFE